MTEGSLTKKMVLFSLPLILSGILQQLYSWVDALIVGNTEGDLALAAIGSAVMVPNVISLLIIGFVSGMSIYAAQLFGQGDLERVWRMLRSTVIVSGAGMLLLGVGLSLGSRQVLVLLNTAEDAFPQALAYLRIYLLGTGFVVIYNVYSAVLRGCGDSTASLWCVLVSSCVNAALDVLFVVNLGWGVSGAAAATVISQFGAAAFVIFYAHRKYRIPLRQKAADPADIRRALRLSAPLAIQSSVKSVGNLILQSFMNGFGSQTVAAVTTAYRVDTVILLPVMNLGTGIATAVAQNAGTGKYRRAQEASRIGTRLMLVLSLVTVVAVLTGGRAVLSLFGLEPETVDKGALFFRCMAVFYPVFGLSVACKNTLDGYGDTVFTSAVSIGALLIRILVSYMIGDRIGVAVFAAAEAVSWAVMLCAFHLRSLLKARRRSLSIEAE